MAIDIDVIKKMVEDLHKKKAKIKKIDAAPEGTKAKKLPKAVKEALEEQFGGNFNKVRVHVGGNAKEVAKGIGARAFTVGHNIFLAKPADYSNHKLLAHELAHVIQQNGKMPPEKDGKAFTSGTKPK